jgi:hypothetical protein
MRRSAGVLGVIAVLVGIPATVGVIAHSNSAPSPPAAERSTTLSARAAADPFLRLARIRARSCRFDLVGHSSINCTLKPGGECEIEPSAGTAQCEQPGKGSTHYLLLQSAKTP